MGRSKERATCSVPRQVTERDCPLPLKALNSRSEGGKICRRNPSGSRNTLREAEDAGVRGSMHRWSLDDVPWGEFDGSLVDPEILAVAKAACLVERNAPDYVAYLCNVFADDLDFQAKIERWGKEEVQHGEALGRWAELADPGFNYWESYRRFCEGYRIPVESTQSVRGSRTGELLARCLVETGTSSLYSALRDATREPVLKFICHRIAGDEFRHYKLFLESMQRYQDTDKLNLLRRVFVVLGRYGEVSDDELSFAYHCANTNDRPYDRRRAGKAYFKRAFGCYQHHHVQRGVGMVLRPIGISPQGVVGRCLTHVAWRGLRRQVGRLQAA
jgi:hypothetical protein